MNTVKSSAHLAVASSTRCRVLSVGCSTERNSPGPVVPSNGAASSLAGGELVAGLLLILLFVVALLTPFERLIPQERNGSKSSHSTSTDLRQKKSSGGTERGQYDEE